MDVIFDGQLFDIPYIVNYLRQCQPTGDDGCLNIVYASSVTLSVFMVLSVISILVICSERTAKSILLFYFLIHTLSFRLQDKLRRVE